MKATKRKLTNVLLAVIMLLSLAGCKPGESYKTEKNLPITTSAEANAYAMGDQIYNSDGVLLTCYTFDESGNVTDENGDVVVAADLVEQFTCIESVAAVGETRFDITAEKLTDETLATRPVTVEIALSLSPENPVNGIVTLESGDPGALYFSYNDNAHLFAHEVERPEDNALSSITLDTADAGDIVVTTVGTFAGDYTITSHNCFKEEVGEIVVSLVPRYMDELSESNGASESSHEHVFTDTVVAPTQKSQGYTIHTCQACGYSFRDEYTDRLPCQHDYKDTVVPATYTDGGYTLHVCSVCGDSYKDAETAVLKCTHGTTKDMVVAPTCLEQGYTLHECTICKNYSYKDSYTDPTGHKWDSGKTTKNPTCGAAGEKTFTCKTCKATKTEPIPATGNHNYVESVIPATCDDGGYTQHTCSVCGDTYRDAHTPALGHTDPQWRVTKEPTCGEAGIREGVCARCGRVIATESIPKSGSHSFQDTVTQPTCEVGGYTTHTCSICGYSYTDNQTAALGHAWEEHAEHVWVGQEQHQVCAQCGMDFTANGLSNDAISAHIKNHVLAGEGGRYYSKMVDVYEDRVIRVCSRCGKSG